MIRLHFIPAAIWDQVVSLDAAEGVRVKPDAPGEYYAIGGVLADGTLVVEIVTPPGDTDTFDSDASFFDSDALTFDMEAA